MTNLVFLLEELSAKEMLKGLLPRFLPENIHPDYIVFQGKRDLESKLYHRLSGWNKPNSTFIVLLDQDNEDCKAIKNRLTKLCENLKESKKIIFRIACHELESWYFGDLETVGEVLGYSQIAKYKNKAKYRIPDKISEPYEELIKMTKGRYQKISGSRGIGVKLSIDNNASHSFQVFIKSIKNMMRKEQS